MNCCCLSGTMWRSGNTHNKHILSREGGGGGGGEEEEREEAGAARLIVTKMGRNWRDSES